MSDFKPLPADYLSDFVANPPLIPALEVPTGAVFEKLSKLNPAKAHGPDDIPSWLLRENGDLLSVQVRDILNHSYSECFRSLPQSWKEANVVPVPKQKPVKNVSKHLRPISLTPVISKIAEEFIVEEFVTTRQAEPRGDTVPAGVPQGTKLGPWLFLVMINDLNLGNLDLWKFVDDMTTAEPLPNNGVSKIQDSVDDLVNKSSANRFQLNVPKCKELRISFAKTEPKFDPIVANSKPLEIIETAKVLGLNISCDLKWNAHLSEVLKKGASRLYFLRQLKRSNIATKDLLSFYLVCARPITEYACQVFHNALPKYLSEDLERLQKRALWIIFPGLSYKEALNAKVEILCSLVDFFALLVFL